MPRQKIIFCDIFVSISIIESRFFCFQEEILKISPDRAIEFIDDLYVFADKSIKEILEISKGYFVPNKLDLLLKKDFSEKYKNTLKSRKKNISNFLKETYESENDLMIIGYLNTQDSHLQILKKIMESSKFINKKFDLIDIPTTYKNHKKIFSSNLLL
jgi:hypothetical protein